MKLVEGKRVRLTMEQKAKLTVFAADHSHLSREAVINWAVEQFDLERTPAPALIISLRKEDKVEWAKRYLSQETVVKELQSKSVKSSQYSELEMILFSWFSRLESNQAVATDKLLRGKALEIARELKASDFKASPHC